MPLCRNSLALPMANADRDALSEPGIPASQRFTVEFNSIPISPENVRLNLSVSILVSFEVNFRSLWGVIQLMTVSGSLC
jgi:hypothetical protein